MVTLRGTMSLRRLLSSQISTITSHDHGGLVITNNHPGFLQNLLQRADLSFLMPPINAPRYGHADLMQSQCAELATFWISSAETMLNM